MAEQRPFLTAAWRYLLMLNYEVEPAVLLPYLPAGTELDLWDGHALVSMVGFLFEKTRLLGLPVPFHTHFEEINLRFYVRRTLPEGQEARRGVVFIKEIVPRAWVARVARWVYGERYLALPTQHTIEEWRKKRGHAVALRPGALVEYSWRFAGRLHRLGGLALGAPRAWQPGSEEEFITQHYWGYTQRGPHQTGEYRVEHPAWRVWPVAQPYLLSDVAALYGPEFTPYLYRPPRSAFLAEGSAVAVYPGKGFSA